MCGIAGVFGAGPDAPVGVRLMTRALDHRGPDGEGFFDGSGVALGIRRLAIIDVAGGQQPIGNEDGTVQVVFNGEIYNHADLRAELDAYGHVFRTTSDTEAIVHGYEQWGIEGCVERLRGMFAFLLWDGNRRELFVARDRLGIKPLYYTRVNGDWRFASEIKALLACGDVPRAVNTEAIGPYLLHQYVPAPATFFAGIHKLLPGHYMRIGVDGAAVTCPFWRLSFEPIRPVPTYEAAVAELRSRVTEAVRLRLMSEVPLGCLLSGGLDSSIVTAAMARLSDQPVRTFTVGFPEMPDLDERRYARVVAERYGTVHTELEVALDANALLDRIVHHLDEPLADAAALPTYGICKAAREHVTVLLTGEGSDELFAGYPRYLLSRAADTLAVVPAGARAAAFDALGGVLPHARAREALRKLARDPGDPVLRNALWTGVFAPEQVTALCPEASTTVPLPDAADWPYAADAPPRDGLHRLLYWDFRRWLVDDVLMKVDKMSMAASVEARVPFLDHQLVEYVCGLPAEYKLRRREGKAILRAAFKDWLPPQTSGRRKAAFRPPLDVWFRGELGRLAADRLRARGGFCSTYLEPRAVEQFLAEHAAGIANHGQRLWTLLCAELWYGQWFASPQGRQDAEDKVASPRETIAASSGGSAPTGSSVGSLPVTPSVPPRLRGETRLRSVLVVPDLPLENWPSMDRYAVGLIRGLDALDRDYVVANALRNGHGRPGPVGQARRYWERLVGYPASFKQARPDVVHVLDHTYAHVLAPRAGSRNVVTIHDLWPLRRLPQAGTLRQRALDLLTRRMIDGIRRADVVTCDSGFSAREAQLLLGLPASRVRVVHLGVEETFFQAPDGARVTQFRRDVFGDVRPALLHVSSCDPRKNIDGVLRIVAAIRHAAPHARLLQVGGRFTEEHRALVQSLGLADAVVQRARISDDELRLAYRSADVLLLPSLYEGFGFPVLEAQAAGLPVVCSDRGSLPEVAGDGALVVDPDRIDDWAAAVLECVENPGARERLVEAGTLNARRFTWERTASQIAATYEELLAK